MNGAFCYEKEKQTINGLNIDRGLYERDKSICNCKWEWILREFWDCGQSELKHYKSGSDFTIIIL